MSHTSRLSYFLITFSYSPSPLSTASIIAFMASSSSSPSQISSISSPDFTHAPRTLNTLFAFAAVSSLYMNSTLHLYLLAILQNIPAGLRCSPVGFVIVTFSPFLSVIRSGRSDCFRLSLSDCCSGFHPVFYCSALNFQV